MVCRPFSQLLWMWLSSWTSSSTFSICSLVYSSNGSRFSLIEPWIKNGACGMYEIFLRKRWRPIYLISVLSMVILPLQLSDSLNSVARIVDLPAPVLPTTPTFMPAYALKLRPTRDGSMVSLYFISTSLNSIWPPSGHCLLSLPTNSLSFFFTRSSSDSS